MLPESLSQAKELCNSFNSIRWTENDVIHCYKSFSSLINQLKMELDNEDDQDDENMDTKMKATLMALVKAKYGSIFTQSVISFLEAEALEISLSERVDMLRKILYVGSRFAEEFSFVGRSAINLDETVGLDFSTSSFHLFLLIGISANELYLQNLNDANHVKTLVQLCREAPTANTALLLAYSRHSTDYSHFVHAIVKNKLSILTEFAQISQTCNDIPIQINTIDVIFRIVLIMKSKRSNSCVSKADLFAYQASFLRATGLTVDKKELQQVYKKTKSPRKTQNLSPVAIFTSKSNSEYKRYIRVLLSEINKGKKVFSHKVNCISLSYSSKQEGSIIMQENDKSSDAFIDVNIHNISFYSKDNVLITFPYKVIDSVTMIKAKEVLFTFNKLEPEFFGDWLEGNPGVNLEAAKLVVSSSSSETLFSQVSTKIGRINSNSSKVQKISEQTDKPAAFRMSKNILSVECGKIVAEQPKPKSSGFCSPAEILSTQPVKGHSHARPPDSRESLLGKHDDKKVMQIPKDSDKAISVKNGSQAPDKKKSKRKVIQRVTRSFSQKQSQQRKPSISTNSSPRAPTESSKEDIFRKVVNEQKFVGNKAGRELNVMGRMEKSCTTNLTTKTSLTNITYGTRVDLIKKQIRKNKSRSLRQRPSSFKDVKLKIEIPSDSLSESSKPQPLFTKLLLMRKTIQQLEKICKVHFFSSFNHYFDRSNKSMWPLNSKRPKWRKAELVESMVAVDEDIEQEEFKDKTYATPTPSRPSESVLLKAPDRPKGLQAKPKRKKAQNVDENSVQPGLNVKLDFDMDSESSTSLDCISVKSANISEHNVSTEKSRKLDSKLSKTGEVQKIFEKYKSKQIDEAVVLNVLDKHFTDDEREDKGYKNHYDPVDDKSSNSGKPLQQLLSCFMSECSPKEKVVKKCRSRALHKLLEKLDANQALFVQSFKLLYKEHQGKQQKYLKSYLKSLVKKSKDLQNSARKRKGEVDKRTIKQAKRLKTLMRNLEEVETNNHTKIKKIKTQYNLCTANIRKSNEAIKQLSKQLKTVVLEQSNEQEDEMDSFQKYVSSMLRLMEKQIQESKKSSSSLRAKLLALERM